MYNRVQRLTYTESYIPGLHISHGGEFSRLPAHIKTYSFYCGLISIILFLPNFRWVSLISVLLIYLPCDIHIFPVCSVSLSLYKPNVPFPPTGSLPLFSEPHGSILSSKLSLCLMGVIMMVPSVSDGAQASVNVQFWVLHLPPSPTTPGGCDILSQVPRWLHQHLTTPAGSEEARCCNAPSLHRGLSEGDINLGLSLSSGLMWPWSSFSK